ncbi:hypothetical protein [Marinomonas algicola]|uniref:hypothetical protein n=1 Tax=Marinomonas algicola TaxID=2773454 RepID=UPI00174EBBFE|nr:hypothetical protein [Marinomonas algicola]
MGLFSSSSKKTTENVSKSQAGQSNTGDINSYNAEAGANITVTDGGAVQSALSLADRVVAQNQAKTANESGTAAAVISRANDNNTALAGRFNDNSTALAAQMNNNAIALAGRSMDNSVNVTLAAGKYAVDTVTAESAANREALLRNTENTMALVHATNSDALNSTQQMAGQALAANGQAMNAMSQFANESLERVADSQETAIDAATTGFQTSIQQLSANQAKSQEQLNNVLSNVMTSGQSEMQADSSKNMVWVVGIAGLAVLAIAMMKG